MPFSNQTPEMPTTQWSLISKLQGTDETEARIALDQLCQGYHYPLYCQIRRRGLDHHDAEDVLHEFLAKLLRNESFGLASAEKGRLRTFLLTALQRFLINWQRGQVRRREREISRESLELIAKAGQRFDQDDFAHTESPDRLYDRQWMQELLKLVLGRIHTRYAARGKTALFVALQPVLLSGGSLKDHDCKMLCRDLEMRPGALRTAIYRLMSDYREAIRAEILQTVEAYDLGKQEFEELMAVFVKG